MTNPDEIVRVPADPAPETDGRIDFNRDWSFVKSDAEEPGDFENLGLEMASVMLPHTWNAADMVVGNLHPYVGAGWYRKRFEAPALKAGQRLLLAFEGANNTYKVWVNGGYAGGRNGGFLATQMDVTDLLEDGDNTVLVRVDSRFDLLAAMPNNIDWNRYGGITRPVWMKIREHAYLTCAGIEVTTPDVSREAATTVVRTHVQEERVSGTDLEIRHTLFDPEGTAVSTTAMPLATSFSRTNTVEAALPVVQNPQLWSDVHPALYSLKTEVLEDSVPIDARLDRIGFRFFHFDAHDGFVLNGQPTKLRGANIHVFFPGLGNALPTRFHRLDMELMKRMGCNYMRTSHYPRPNECLDRCDELGILVIEEQPYWHGSIRARHGEAAVDNAPRLIHDLVRQHGNHPCIIAWNTVNEVMIAPFFQPGTGHLQPNDPRRAAWSVNPKEYPYLRRHLRKMVDAFKEVDSARPVSMVVGGQWQRNDDACLTSIGDLVAYNGGAMSLPADGGAFVGPKTGKRYAFKPDYYRELYPERISLMSEGVLNDDSQVHARGDWQTAETAWRRNALYWNIINERPWFCGGSMWCFTDYSANGQQRLHGAVDAFRLPKDLFFFYEAMWSDHPVLHILGHWNHEQGTVRNVVVFTNCKDVELCLNGKSLGRGISCADDYPYIEHPPLIWTGVRFEAGALTVTGAAGGETLRDARVTAGVPAKIMLTASNTELLADGRDISYVDATVCDADGHRCYTAGGVLKLGVSGSAVLGGPGELHLQGGMARAAVRSNGKPGAITVNADCDGLPGASLLLKAE